MAALYHHDLCFGCGQANPFGLQIELLAGPDGSLAGRFFVKQDHQGPGGVTHPGVLAAALVEAAGLVAPEAATIGAVEVSYADAAPIGSFVALSATRQGSVISVRARSEEGMALADAQVALRPDG